MCGFRKELTSKRDFHLWNSLYHHIIRSKTLHLRLTNGEVITYGLWHKTAVQHTKSKRHLFERTQILLPAPDRLCNFSSYGWSYNELMMLVLEKVDLFLWVIAVVVQILRTYPLSCASSVILVPNMSSVPNKMNFYSSKIDFLESLMQHLSSRLVKVKPQSACSVTVWRWGNDLALVLDYLQNFFVWETPVYIRNNHCSMRKATCCFALQFVPCASLKNSFIKLVTVCRSTPARPNLRI